LSNVPSPPSLVPRP